MIDWILGNIDGLAVGIVIGAAGMWARFALRQALKEARDWKRRVFW